MLRPFRLKALGGFHLRVEFGAGDLSDVLPGRQRLTHAL
jgi:hypothetical protein